MKIAIPLAGGKLSAHFGHCQEFAIIDADPATCEAGNCDCYRSGRARCSTSSRSRYCPSGAFFEELQEPVCPGLRT